MWWFTVSDDWMSNICSVACCMPCLTSSHPICNAVLLGGYAPFEGPVDLLAQAIISGEYEFHEKYWDEISTDAKDMISNLLQVDPEIRLTADDALQSPYMILEDEALSTKDLSGAQSSLKGKVPIGGPAVAGIGGKVGSLGAEFTTSLVNFIFSTFLVSTSIR